MLFTKTEYKERLIRVQNSMQEKGIELLISQDTSNMNYLTGYDAWSFYYAQCVLVHVNAEEPICFVRAQDAGGAYIKTYLKNENIIAYDEKYIHTWPLHPYDYLVEIIKKKNWDKLCIGLEMDSHYFTAYCYEKIKLGLPNARIKDSERLVNWARLVKSDAEIELMKSAALISEINFSSNLVKEFQKNLVDYLLSEKFLDRKKIQISDFDIKYTDLINLINLNAPVKIISKDKNEEEIVTIFNEIIGELKKVDLRSKIKSLEDKASANLDEKLYSELLSLRNQLKGS